MNIYGASGHGKVIIDVIKSTNPDGIDFVFDDDPEKKEILGYEVNNKISSEMLNIPTILALGNNRTRKKIASGFKGDFHPAIAHKTAVISESAKLGKGTVILANAAVNGGASIGKHCIVNTGAVVEHDVILEDFVHISPGAILTGEVQVKEGTQIGAGAIVIPGKKIGKWATIGAGAVIISDVPDFAVVVGNPCKIIKYNEFENEER